MFEQNATGATLKKGHRAHRGDGVERCYFDWLEENQEQEGTNEGDEE